MELIALEYAYPQQFFQNQTQISPVFTRKKEAKIGRFEFLQCVVGVITVSPHKRSCWQNHISTTMHFYLINTKYQTKRHERRVQFKP